MMNKNLIITLVLGVLLLVSVVQAVQLNTLKTTIVDTDFSTLATKSGSTPLGSGGGGASSLDSLPTMVGGC